MIVVPGPIQYFSSDDDHPEVTESPNKRRRIGRKCDESRDLRIHVHVAGPDCGCKKQCITIILSNDEKKDLIDNFNNMSNRFNKMLISVVFCKFYQFSGVEQELM